MKGIGKVQELYLELASWSLGDEPIVALRTNKHLWRAVLPHASLKMPQIELRNLALWNQPSFDTLFILPEPGKEDILYGLLLGLAPDELDWYKASRVEEEGFGVFDELPLHSEKAVLRAWWD